MMAPISCAQTNPEAYNRRAPPKPFFRFLLHLQMLILRQPMARSVGPAPCRSCLMHPIISFVESQEGAQIGIARGTQMGKHGQGTRLFRRLHFPYPCYFLLAEHVYSFRQNCIRGNGKRRGSLAGRKLGKWERFFQLFVFWALKLKHHVGLSQVQAAYPSTIGDSRTYEVLSSVAAGKHAFFVDDLDAATNTERIYVPVQAESLQKDIKVDDLEVTVSKEDAHPLVLTSLQPPRHPP
ncbi:uncharacterized protein BT62DRAFT_1081394 [Guyanagaster necrorhizus]|uniref:Uncharacterized protein n=1 Tax=Guyanagaster necrorhizus TaxID=856835 RepID=A0A9P8AKZ3_9AGAR|nr:uncharacterized protein BT62DRAFT_1081394 [Guyanagaster necrorhizus MCA 3950]KAG7439698.1 hypothetical protein BT62DRAFT_1081394 [Guyanagaster necrorhizus MCA 3950]